MEDRLPRKLAAILFADMAGYSRLSGANEDATHKSLMQNLDVISDSIEGLKGQVVNFAGDAVLAKFDAAVDALGAAVAVQRELAIRSRGLPDDQRIEFRIGVNVGDVIEDRDDIYGDGVNVAARLESLAEPGGICISEAVRTAVGKKLDLNYEDMGKQRLKNIEEPVRAYKVVMATEERPKDNEPATTTLVLPDKPSIAVLPFTNLTGDPEQELFADGLADEIITGLSRVSGLFVISHNSTMMYKGRLIDVRDVGREQGVRYVLEGGIRKSGNDIKVTAQLIDSVSGLHVWAEQYKRNLSDIFAVQEDITHNVVVELQVKLVTGERAREWAVGTKNIEAWELATQSKALVEKHVRDDLLIARRHLKRAIELDSGYSAAWTFLGWTYWEEAYWRWSPDTEKALEQAHDCVERAQSVNSPYPGSYGLLGNILMLRGEMNDAIAMCEKGVEIAPNDSSLLALLATVLIYSGRANEAIPKLQRAIRMCPFPPGWYLALLGQAYHLDNKNKAAISALNNAIEREPDSALARGWLASALVESGDLDLARKICRTTLEIEPSISAHSLVEGLTSKSDYDRVVANLVAAGLPE